MPWMVAAVAVLYVIVGVTCRGKWSYSGEGDGPTYWSRTFPQCQGLMQSPVDLLPGQAQYDPRLSINIDGYDRPQPDMNITLINDGHTAMVDIKGNLFLSGYQLPYKYKAAQFHFHWGTGAISGSEHTINGHNYPGEVHMVHHADLFNSVSSAADKPQGLAVLGTFLDIGPEDNPFFEDIVRKLPHIARPNQVTTLNSLIIRNLLPKNLTKFFRYEGSLTTPPCYESVLWTVFAEPVLISQRQMNLFQTALYTGHEGEKMHNNFRPTQPMHGRRLYASYNPLVPHQLPAHPATGTEATVTLSPHDTKGSAGRHSTSGGTTGHKHVTVAPHHRHTPERQHSTHHHHTTLPGTTHRKFNSHGTTEQKVHRHGTEQRHTWQSTTDERTTKHGTTQQRTTKGSTTEQSTTKHGTTQQKSTKHTTSGTTHSHESAAPQDRWSTSQGTVQQRTTTNRQTTQKATRRHSTTELATDDGTEDIFDSRNMPLSHIIQAVLSKRRYDKLTNFPTFPPFPTFPSFDRRRNSPHVRRYRGPNHQ